MTISTYMLYIYLYVIYVATKFNTNKICEDFCSFLLFKYHISLWIWYFFLIRFLGIRTLIMRNKSITICYYYLESLCNFLKHIIVIYRGLISYQNKIKQNKIICIAIYYLMLKILVLQIWNLVLWLRCI